MEKVTVSIPNRRNKEKNPDKGKEIREKKEKNESIQFKSKLSNPNPRREEEDRRDPPEGLAAISTAGRRDVAERDGEPSHSSTSHRRRKGLESSTTERPLDGGVLDLERTHAPVRGPTEAASTPPAVTGGRPSVVASVHTAGKENKEKD